MIISGFRLCADVDSTVVGVMAWSGGTRLAEAVSGQLALQWSWGKPWPVLQCRHSAATSHTAYL